MQIIFRVIDLRSDTLTKPSDLMRKAMAESVVGDDCYKEDPTVNELESYAAKVVGKEAAIFVPSGTMSNLIAENTHNICNGTPLPLEFIDKVCEIAKSNGFAVHMDGARVFNASLKTGQPVPRIVKNCDSVSFCLSKGLGCPVGSILAGSTKLIERAIRCRRVLGGGMRQAGVLAAAGLFALKENIERLHFDHKHTLMIASVYIKALGLSGGQTA
ncbi:unnamed protein product [Oppiella nova]|uniref:Aromatic amino acid beta-eliminating lyase/threonine aldolase domain-containing protein n=1 Tax=Oppiella nova TaxID=334625 RepID=A0A7R9LRQ0_9ACAR|nr:unnamed protein product [Oppiella nova]CAG2165699.1 unnamed protein product [Oppiella nova]